MLRINWNRDELILALDLYLRARPVLPTEDDGRAIYLSGLLRRLGQMNGVVIDDKYRNPAGVEAKLENFGAIDPDCRAGRPKGGHLTAAVWESFSSRLDEVAPLAAQIRAFIESGTTLAGAPDEEDADADESPIIRRVHEHRERARGLRQKKVEQIIRRGERLTCSACGTDFEAMYGDRGRGFIEVHHTKALSTLRPGERTKLSDLVLVCSNCHRMIHRQRPWWTLNELRAAINRP